jgi:acyl-CoA reductase-like NAD-dependent aldehyde dehydrogenase
VPAQLLSQAEKIAAEVADNTVIGAPSDKNTEVGPLRNKPFWDKVQDFIKTGIEEGATLIAGGLGRPEGFDSGYYVKATVFSNVNNEMTIAQEEAFGPVLTIIPYKDEADAIRIANESKYGLSSYIASKNSSSAERVAKQLDVGMVHLNGGTIDLGLPFGGYKLSGMGRKLGKQGLSEYLEIKSIYRTKFGFMQKLGLAWYLLAPLILL